METLANFFCSHAPYAHYLLFFAILLTGLNIPFPEDLLVIIGGVIVATCVPDNYTIMFLSLWSAAAFSAYEAYWIGRYFGPRLYDIRFFRHVVTPERVNRVGLLLERFGLLTFLIGRFIPFGARSCIFMTSGLWKMPFGRFAFRDGIGAFIATFTLFHLGYHFGENYKTLLSYFRTYELGVLSVIAIFVSVAVVIWYARRSLEKSGS